MTTYHDPLSRVVSGCQALKDCPRSGACLRARLAREYPLVGFHGYRLCYTAEYQFFIPNPPDDPECPNSA